MSEDAPESINEAPKNSKVGADAWLAFLTADGIAVLAVHFLWGGGDWLPSWVACVVLIIVNLAVAMVRQCEDRHPYLFGLTLAMVITTVWGIIDTCYVFKIAVWEQFAVAFLQAGITFLAFVVTCVVGAMWLIAVSLDARKPSA